MKTLLAKSYRLKRYQMVLVILIIALIIWIMLRYFAMIAANFERLTFEHNLALLERLFQVQAIIVRKNNLCHMLNDPSLFKDAVGGLGLEVAPMSDSASKMLKKWRYFPNRQVLVYYVGSKEFFRPAKAEIHVRFICWNKKIFIQVSPHQWCREMGILGCKAWEKHL